MRLTKKQKSIIDTAVKLESSLGKGNIFLRYIKSEQQICFIGHKKGSAAFTILKEFNDNGEIRPIKVDSKTYESMMKNRFLVNYDTNHHPNLHIKTNIAGYLGARIRTEIFEEELQC